MYADDTCVMALRAIALQKLFDVCFEHIALQAICY